MDLRTAHFTIETSWTFFMVVNLIQVDFLKNYCKIIIFEISWQYYWKKYVNIAKKNNIQIFTMVSIKELQILNNFQYRKLETRRRRGFWHIEKWQTPKCHVTQLFTHWELLDWSWVPRKSQLLFDQLIQWNVTRKVLNLNDNILNLLAIRNLP